jgi:hypothetical protein
VLIYRALTWALPILLGVCCWLWWHQSQLRPSAVDAGGQRMAMPKGPGAANIDRPGSQAPHTSHTPSSRATSIIATDRENA